MNRAATLARRLAGPLLLLAAALALHAQVARKGLDRGADALLNENFESNSWEIGWTTVDADGSGSGWRRFSEDDWYDARSGSWSIGTRFNADGSASDDWLITPPLRPDSSRRDFSFYYRSQDADYPETFEVRSLSIGRGERLEREELVARLPDFRLEQRVESAPVVWTRWETAAALDTNAVWFFAVRCVSRDRFVLLVDDAAGPWTVPQAKWFLEEEFARADWGLVARDSLVYRPFRVWNLDEDSLLMLRVANRPSSPFAFSQELDAETLYVPADDTLGFVAGAWGFRIEGEPADTVHAGSYSDTLVFEWTHLADGSEGEIRIPMTVSLYDPDSLQDGGFLLTEDFDGEEPLGAWRAGLADCATDTVSWQVAEISSSRNFTVPWRGSSFAFVNSDLRGRFLADGSPMAQCALLMSPWFDPRATAQGEAAGGLLLGADLVYDELGGGVLELLADAGSGWETAARIEPAPDAWERRSWDLSAWVSADSLRLAFSFQGSWAQGAAVDDLLLLAVPDALPGAAVEEAPPAPPDVVLSIAPNPFNPATTIRVTAPSAARLEVSVYNLLGQLVLRQDAALLRRGDNALPLDLSGRAAGLYLVRLEALQADGRRWEALRKVTYLK